MPASSDQAVRPRLTVAMIVRDEQEVLADSLRSVRSIADEIVVLDTGSTDRTVAIAEQHGVRVSRTDWSSDFSAARNCCLCTAEGDWILWLDAGETLQQASAEEVRGFVDLQADATKAYLMMLEVAAADAAASAEQTMQLRLIPNRRDLRFSGRVRETLQPSIEAAGLETDAAPGRIFCHARRNDPARKVLIAQRDLELAKLELEETDGDPAARLWLAMGEAYGNLSARDQARQAYRRVIASVPPASTEMLEAYYGLLATYDGDPFCREAQLSTCVEALEVFPFDAQLLLAMGNYLQTANRLDLATRSFETAVRYGQVDLGIWHMSELTEVAADCLAIILQIQGRNVEALRVLEDARQRCPDSIRLGRRLLDLYVRQDLCDEAVELADQLSTHPDEREPLHDAVRGACKAATKDWTAALGYLQSAYAAGCTDPICLRWLSVTLLSNGRVEAARPVLAEWQQVEPTDMELRAYLAAVVQRDEAVACEEPSEQETAADSLGRWYRVDPADWIPGTATPIFPIVSQTSSDEVDEAVVRREG
ncbi:MAG: glycosyltransferase [Pirellulales bacterium]|nr:glycosyltransferase [Pirellulales bacterium]